jgi:hypothetical protein
MYIADVGIHSFGVSFSVWLSVWLAGVVGSREGEGGRGGTGCVARLHVGVAHFKSKIQSSSSEDCKNVSKYFLLSESKRPLGGGASRGEAVGSLLHILNTKQQRILLAPPTVHHLCGRSP